jgi:plastocyanin
MRNALLASFASLLAVSACGDDGGTTPPIDGPSAVTKVTCAGATITATVTTMGLTAFDPMVTTITAGQIVQFTMPAEHNAVSDTGAFRSGGVGEDACFRFDVAGSYPFHCEPHLFTGRIVVQ